MLVRRCCRTPWSVPRMTSLLLSASFTPVLPLKIAWRWAPFVRSRRGRPRPTWNRFERLCCLSLRLQVRVGQGFVLSHVRDALRPASSDFLLRLLSEVVSLLLRGEVPESVRPYVCGASIVALRKPNGSLRPIAICETIRRLTSKVAVDLITERPVRSSSLCNLGSRLLMDVRPSFTLHGSGFFSSPL